MKYHLNTLLISAMAAGSFMIAAAGSIAAEKSLENARHPEFAAGQILVKFKDTPDIVYQVESLMHDLAARTRQVIGKSGISLITLDKEIDIEATVQQMLGDPRVEFVQPNYIYHATAVPNDPLYDPLNNQWGLGKIDAESAWDVQDSGEYARDCGEIVVAVLDTGINYKHADLKNNMWTGTANHGRDFVAGTPNTPGDWDDDPMPTGGATHGTHVAGTIGAEANNNTGIAGVCWQASIMSVRVLDSSGSGYTSDIIAGIDWAAANGADVINMSLGGTGGFQGDSLSTAIEQAGVVTVVAAGNGGSDGLGDDNDITPFYPCNYDEDNIICVASLDSNDQLSSYSNFGANSVDVGEPGSSILSTWPGGTLSPAFSSWQRTSASGSSWNDGLCSYNIGQLDTLYIPAGWCSGGANYLDNTDADAWYTFNLNGLEGAGISYYELINTEAGNDPITTWRNAAGGNPVGGTGTLLASESGIGQVIRHQFNLENCLTANCSIGFNFTSNGSNNDQGVGITLLEVQQIEDNANDYAISSGTSMATPHVSGIAAMVMAWNPGYNVDQVIEAIFQGGSDLTSLATTTVTGKSANALGALSHITAPTGVGAVQLP